MVSLPVAPKIICGRRERQLRRCVEVAGDRIVAGAAIDGVGTAAAGDDVIAAIAVDGIGKATAGKSIGPSVLSLMPLPPKIVIPAVEVPAGSAMYCRRQPLP